MGVTKLGLNGKTYRNTGTYASPTWVEIKKIKDLTLNLSKTEADVSNRSTKWKLTAAALKDGSISFNMPWIPSDASCQALQDSFIEDTQLDMLILDGSITQDGSQGLRATMEVFSFPRSENLEDAMMIDVEMKPTEAENPPEWYVVDIGGSGSE